MGTRVRLLVPFLCLAGAFAGCDNATEPDGTAEPVDVSGAAQKGPFILGAQVQVNVLDSAGNPTGTVFNTTTTSDRGEFSLLVDSGLVDVATDGFYYNEATWRLSSGRITMRALADVGDSAAQAIYVNALTHITHRRALRLYADSGDARAAIAQAEMEAYAVFPWLAVPASVAPGSRMNLFGGDDASNAYLLGLSCGLSYAAFDASDGTDNDAQLQQLINGIAFDLEADGVVSGALEEQIRETGDFDPYECVASLQARLDAFGDDTTALPDPQLAFDWDRDGVPNAADTDTDGDGLDASADPVVSLAVLTDGAGVALEVLAVLGGSGRGRQLVSPRGGTYAYAPVDIAVELELLTDVVEAVAASDAVVVRTGDGSLYRLVPHDNTAAMAYGSASAIFAGLNRGLLIVDTNGDFTTLGGLTVNDVARVAGRDPNFVYLDGSGGVHIIEDSTVTDVGGLDGITVIDVAADFQAAAENGYLAVSDAGAMYRFSAADPTAAEDTTVTGILSFHVSNGAVFAITASEVWNLMGGGPGTPTVVADVGGLTSFAGPATWGESGIAVYVAIDTAGDIQLVTFTGDLTPGTLLRPMYVPR